MADLIVTSPDEFTDSGLPLKELYVDQGDGTWAQKIAGTGGSGTSATQGLGAYQTVVLQNAAAATGDGTSINLSGMGTMNVAVTGTFVGTVTFEAQDASGAWAAVLVQLQGSTSLVSSTTTTGVFRCPIGGYAAFRARVSAYTSGTITVTAFAENTAYTPAIQNVGMYDKIAGEDLTNDVLKVNQVFSNTYISSATTTVVKTGAGLLHTIVIGETAAGATTIYDNTAASGTIIAVLKASIAEQTFTFDAAFAIGLTVVTAGASKISVNWR